MARARQTNEFFHARSMLTPGIAGATVMMITSSLVSAFNVPGSLIALVLSLMLGLVAMADESLEVYNRIVFYIVNSLIIFSMAYGLNSAGVDAFQQRADQVIEREVPDGFFERFFQPWPIGD